MLNRYIPTDLRDIIKFADVSEEQDRAYFYARVLWEMQNPDVSKYVDAYQRAIRSDVGQNIKDPSSKVIWLIGYSLGIFFNSAEGRASKFADCCILAFEKGIKIKDFFKLSADLDEKLPQQEVKSSLPEQAAFSLPSFVARWGTISEDELNYRQGHAQENIRKTNENLRELIQGALGFPSDSAADFTQLFSKREKTDFVDAFGMVWYQLLDKQTPPLLWRARVTYEMLVKVSWEAFNSPNVAGFLQAWKNFFLDTKNCEYALALAAGRLNFVPEGDLLRIFHHRYFQAKEGQHRDIWAEGYAYFCMRSEGNDMSDPVFDRIAQNYATGYELACVLKLPTKDYDPFARAYLSQTDVAPMLGFDDSRITDAFFNFYEKGILEIRNAWPGFWYQFFQFFGLRFTSLLNQPSQEYASLMANIDNYYQSKKVWWRSENDQTIWARAFALQQVREIKDVSPESPFVQKYFKEVKGKSLEQERQYFKSFAIPRDEKAVEAQPLVSPPPPASVPNPVVVQPSSPGMHSPRL